MSLTSWYIYLFKGTIGKPQSATDVEVCLKPSYQPATSSEMTSSPAGMKRSSSAYPERFRGFGFSVVFPSVLVPTRVPKDAILLLANASLR